MLILAWTIFVLKFHFPNVPACGEWCASCDSATVCNNCTSRYTMVDGEATGSRVCARKYKKTFQSKTNHPLANRSGGVPKWTSLNRSRKQGKGLELGFPFGRGLELGEGSQHCKQNGALLCMGQGVLKWTSSNRSTHWFKAVFGLTFLDLAVKIQKIILGEEKLNLRKIRLNWTSENLENWNLIIITIIYFAFTY